jgi:hypothetical protein
VTINGYRLSRCAKVDDRPDHKQRTTKVELVHTMT